jgi:phasin family protein
MTSISEQMSAVRNRQFDAQLDFMRAMTAQAFATAEQVLALNINTTRASVERTADTVRQLFSITDPRDLFSVGSHTQEQLSSMFAYSRELFSIAVDARLNLARSGAAVPAPQAEQEPAAQAGQEPAAQAVASAAQPQETPGQASAPQAELSRPGKKVVEAAAQPEAELPATAKPIAKAVGKVTGKRAELPHPAAAVELAAGKADVQLPEIKPGDIPPAAAAALDLKQPASKPPRKK